MNRNLIKIIFRKSYEKKYYNKKLFNKKLMVKIKIIIIFKKLLKIRLIILIKIMNKKDYQFNKERQEKIFLNNNLQ